MVLRLAYCFVIRAGSIESFSSAHVPTTTSAAFLLIPKPLPALCRLAFAVQSVLASYLIPIPSKLASFDVPSS